MKKKQWFTIYFNNGVKRYDHCEVNELNSPIINPVELMSISTMVQGFDFIHSFNSKSKEWVKNPVQESTLLLYQTAPSDMHVIQLEKLIQLYEAGKLGEKDLCLEESEHVFFTKIPAMMAAVFWTRVGEFAIQHQLLQNV